MALIQVVIKPCVRHQKMKSWVVLARQEDEGTHIMVLKLQSYLILTIQSLPSLFPDLL